MAKRHGNPWTDKELNVLMDYVKRKDDFYMIKDMCEEIGEIIQRTPNAVYRKIYETKAIKDEFDKRKPRKLIESERLNDILESNFHLIPTMNSDDWFQKMEDITGLKRSNIVHRVHSPKLKDHYNEYEFLNTPFSMSEYKDEILQLCTEGEYEWMVDMIEDVAHKIGLDKKKVSNYIYNNGYDLDTINEMRIEAGSKPLRTPRDGFSIDEMIEIEDMLMENKFKTKTEAYQAIAEKYRITYPVAVRRMLNCGLNTIIEKE